MGQVGSSVYKTVTAPFRSQHISNNQRSAVFQDPSTLGITPFVYTRRGSQYFDEDGQLAHEFYELKKNKITDRISMTRMDGNLVPQGEIELPYPRLHTDLPVVICEARLIKTRH